MRYDNMGLLDTIFRLPGRYDNAEPDSVEEVGVPNDDLTNGTGVDLIDVTPFKVNRTVINCRNAAKDPLVKGILTDNITKTNNYIEIKCDNPKAKEYLEKRCKEWDISQLIDDMLYKGMVDGNAFLNIWWENNHLQYRWLAYDGKNYRIKRIYDENGRVMGYKQLTKRNSETNKGWLRKAFDELKEYLEELTFNFQLDEIVEIKYMERDGEGQSIVMDILDLVHDKRVLFDLMVKIPYKNSNIIQLTMGNEAQPGKRLKKENREQVEEVVSDYHNKGVITLPFGYDMKVLKGGALPDIPSYLKHIERNIFIGLNTPEALFTSESSNRATADIQLDSPSTGRVLFLQYNQEWVNKIISEHIFKRELERNGYPDVEASIQFNKEEEIDDEGRQFKHKPIQKVGEEEETDE